MKNLDNTLITNRLTLRSMLESDFEAYQDYGMNLELMKYIRPIGTLEEVKEGVWMALAVEITESKMLIGDVGFRYHSKEHQQIKIGYKFHKDYHGKGYGTETMDAFIKLIFDKWPFHKLVAYYDPRNAASFKLMQRYGMKCQ